MRWNVSIQRMRVYPASVNHVCSSPLFKSTDALIDGAEYCLLVPHLTDGWRIVTIAIQVDEIRDLRRPRVLLEGRNTKMRIGPIRARLCNGRSGLALGLLSALIA